MNYNNQQEFPDLPREAQPAREHVDHRGSGYRRSQEKEAAQHHEPSRRQQPEPRRQAEPRRPADQRPEQQRPEPRRPVEPRQEQQQQQRRNVDQQRHEQRVEQRRESMEMAPSHEYDERRMPQHYSRGDLENGEMARERERQPTRDERDGRSSREREGLDGRPAKQNARYTSRIEEFHERGGGEGTRSLDYGMEQQPPQSAAEHPGLNRSMSGTAMGGGRPSNPVDDIVGILQQQAGGAGPRRSTGGAARQSQDTRQNYMAQQDDRTAYRGGPGGGRYNDRGPYGGGGGSRFDAANSLANKNVADLASLLELKARLATEKDDRVQQRHTNRRNRDQPDMSNTSNWPALS